MSILPTRKWIPRKNNKPGHYEPLLKCVAEPAESTIKEAARRKDDKRLMREVNGFDLLTREACCHNTYHREYTRCVGTQKPDTQSTEDAKRLEVTNKLLPIFENMWRSKSFKVRTLKG